MFSLRSLMMIALVGGGALMFSPQAKEAVAQDRYWNNYWRWYDNDYRTYYNRQYRNYNRNYGYDNNPYYRSQYNRYNSPYNYGYRDYNTYYRGGRYWNRGNSVNVGGLRIQWR